MLELSLVVVCGIIIIAFFCEFVDSTLGMGYGTTMTPLLLILGFTPMQIVPAVLLSELITGVSASFFHHREGNVNFKPKTTNILIIIRKLKSIGIIESYKRGIPKHLKVVLVLVSCSIVGAVVAVFIARAIPKLWLSMYIACLVIIMGIIMLLSLNRQFKFSWLKISSLGLIASFNKGLTGGGYGPLVASGQILSGVDGKNAIGITALAEGLTCFVGVLTYVFTARKSIDWQLAPYIIIGAVCSVPFSAKIVKRISINKLKIAIAIITIILGTYTLIKNLRTG